MNCILPVQCSRNQRRNDMHFVRDRIFVRSTIAYECCYCVILILQNWTLYGQIQVNNTITTMLKTLQSIGVNTCCTICDTIRRPCIGCIIRYRYILCCSWDFWQYCQIQIYEAIAIGNYRFQRHRILACLIVLTTIPCQCITVAEDHCIRSWSDRIMNI